MGLLSAFKDLRDASTNDKIAAGLGFLSPEFRKQVRERVRAMTAQHSHPIIAACNVMEYEYLLRHALGAHNEKAALHRELWQMEDYQLLGCDSQIQDAMRARLTHLYNECSVAAKELFGRILAMSQAEEKVLKMMGAGQAARKDIYTLLSLVHEAKAALIKKG